MMTPLEIVESFRGTKAGIAPCRPPVWAQTGHLQTILGHLLPSPRVTEKYETLDVTLESESERIRTNYLKGNKKIVLYLFHGLNGSSEATYMHRTALIGRELGFHVFMNNHRGCGEGSGLATEPYHSGRSEDLSKVIDFGRKMLPDHFHIAIGFSLSANALLLLAANIRAHILPDVAIAVNGPIDLDRASQKLTEGLNRIYDKNFLIGLKDHVRANHGKSRNYPRVRTLRDFDEEYTAPYGGFKNREEYYKTCSAGQYLSQIQIPTLLLSSWDDPFVDVCDYENSKLSRTTVLHLEKHGGHMGYLSKESHLRYSRWLDYALWEYLTPLSRLT